MRFRKVGKAQKMNGNKDYEKQKTLENKIKGEIKK